MNKKIKRPQHITFEWLRKHVPVKMWLAFIGILLSTFTFGFYLSAVPIARNMANSSLPYYRSISNLFVKTNQDYDNPINKLVDGHNARLKDLQKRLLYEEKHTTVHLPFIDDQRDEHGEAASRIRDTIEKENQNFREDLKTLKLILE